MIGTSKQGPFAKIPLGRLCPPKVLLRKEEDNVSDLANSIRKCGLLHPILVRPVRRGYEIIAGFRRYRAFLMLHIGEIPAIIREASDREALEIRLAENVRRLGLSPQERKEILLQLQRLHPTRTSTELESWMGDPHTEPEIEIKPKRKPTPALESVTEEGSALEPPPKLRDTNIIGLPTRHAETPDPVSRSTPTMKLSTASPDRTGPTADEEPLVMPPESQRPSILELPTREKGGETRKREKPDLPAKKVKKYPKKPVACVNRLISGVARKGELDLVLLNYLTEDLFQKVEEQSPLEFLDLTYDEPSAKYLPRHIYNVAKLALYIGRAMNVIDEGLSQLCRAALLHDVGILKVPPRIIKKTAPLTDKEKEKLHQHPLHSTELLKSFDKIDDDVRRAIAEHHEKPNGKGYPQGLNVDAIHPLARMLLVVDAYEALVSPRVYKLPLLPHEAITQLRKGAEEGEFDEASVEALLHALSHYPIGSYLRLSGGEIARVVGATPGSPDKPQIQIVADAAMNRVGDQKVRDLTLETPFEFTPIPKP